MSVFEVIDGCEGPCLVLDDTRIAGPKPWGGGKVSLRFETRESYVRERTCRFIDDSDGEFPPKCSVCGYEPSIYECSWLGDGGYEFEGNYCPNCGARIVVDA